MANFATSRTTEKVPLHQRRTGKVIVQHEAFLGFALEGPQPLHVFTGAESSRYQSLGFAASKDCRTVGTGQHADFNPDISNLIELAAIGTTLLFDDLLAEYLFAQEVEVIGSLLAASMSSSSMVAFSSSFSFLMRP